jgi:hypothetical protein
VTVSVKSSKGERKCSFRGRGSGLEKRRGEKKVSSVLILTVACNKLVGARMLCYAVCNFVFVVSCVV